MTVRRPPSPSPSPILWGEGWVGAHDKHEERDLRDV